MHGAGSATFYTLGPALDDEVPATTSFAGETQVFGGKTQVFAGKTQGFGGETQGLVTDIEHSDEETSLTESGAAASTRDGESSLSGE